MFVIKNSQLCGKHNNRTSNYW